MRHRKLVGPTIHVWITSYHTFFVAQGDGCATKMCVSVAQLDICATEIRVAPAEKLREPFLWRI